MSEYTYFNECSEVDQYVQVTKHLRGTPKFSAQGETDTGCIFDAIVEWEDSAREYQISRITVSRGTSRAPVDGNALRGVRVSELIRDFFEFDVQQIDPEDEGMGILIAADNLSIGAERLRVQQLRDSGVRPKPTASVLEVVSTIYEAAKVTGAKPVVMIKEDFGIPERTASHWIKLARERGHLEK